MAMVNAIFMSLPSFAPLADLMRRACSACKGLLLGCTWPEEVERHASGVGQRVDPIPRIAVVTVDKQQDDLLGVDLAEVDVSIGKLIYCDLDHFHIGHHFPPLRRVAMGAVLYCRIELTGTARPSRAEPNLTTRVSASHIRRLVGAAGKVVSMAALT